MWNRKSTRLLTACTVALLASAPAHALIISKSNTNPVVVDGGGAPNDFATLLVKFAAGDFSGADDLVQSLTVDIDFIKCAEALSTPLPAGCSGQTSADNASVSQIGFSLTDSFGTIIDLVFPTTSSTFGSYSDTSPGGRIQVRFDDSAVDLVGFSTPSFMSGTFAPEGFLSAASGKSAIGDWTLAITNTGAGDAPLGVARFAVNVTVNDAPSTTVPEPDTMVLLGLGLAGVMAFRRRAIFSTAG